MTTQVWKTFESILNITNMTIVPYGNAHETYDTKSGLYQFVCQHGPQECLGNIIHVSYKH